MSARQLGIPMIVSGGVATPLQRVALDESFRNEDWLQDLLYAHPHLIPIDEIEPVFSGLIPVARELPTSSGFLDLIYINSQGHLTLVETKLWRNPEARRSVVAQIIDYAKDMSRWSYDDLICAVKKAASSSEGDPLMKMAREVDAEFDEARFVDTVSRNLRLGRFLLLIVGDGIQEGVEHMVDFLQMTPRLGFTLGLVELALYRLESGKDEPLFVQPRILARTREVIRAVVEIKTNLPVDAVSVKLPSATPLASETGGGITQDEFLQRVASKNGPDVAEFAKWILENAVLHRLRLYWGNKNSVGLMYDDVESGLTFSFGNVGVEGHYICWLLSDQCKRIGLPEEAWQTYFEDVARLVPGAVIQLKRSRRDYAELFLDGDHVPLGLLAPHRDAWFSAIDLAIERIRQLLEERDA